MEKARYYVALVVSTMMLPPALAWVFIHPFIRRWRRVGPAGTYVFILIFVTLGIGALWSVRDRILAVEFGFRPALLVPAAISFVAAVMMRFMWRRELRPATLLGAPEILGRTGAGVLVTEGIYARVRHPRYIEIGLALLAASLFSNYLASYAVLLLYMPLIYAVALLEERELRDRFGEAYVEYCRSVPRFVPRLRRRRGG